MAETPKYLAIGWDEMETPLFRATRGPALKMYLVLRKWANWDTGRVDGAFSFFAQAAGVAKSNGLRQMKKLAAAGLLQFLKCRPGRMPAENWREFLTAIQLFDFHGRPLAVRNRTDIGADSHRNRREIAPNTPLPIQHETTNKEEGTRHTPLHAGARKQDSEVSHVVTAGDPLEFLDSLGIRNARTVEELSEIASLPAMRAAWEVACNAATRGRIKARTPTGEADRVGFFIGTLKNQWRDKLPTPPGTPRGAASATSDKQTDSQAGRDSARPANRPLARPGSAQEAENAALAKFHKEIDAKRAAQAGRGAGVAHLGKVFHGR